jgi:hypothetical protein
VKSAWSHIGDIVTFMCVAILLATVGAAILGVLASCAVNWFMLGWRAW